MISYKDTGYQIADRVQHRMRRSFLTNKQPRVIGIALQITLGDNHAPVKTQAEPSKALASIGEIIRAKLAEMAERKTGSRAT